VALNLGWKGTTIASDVLTVHDARTALPEVTHDPEKTAPGAFTSGLLKESHHASHHPRGLRPDRLSRRLSQQHQQSHRLLRSRPGPSLLPGPRPALLPDARRHPAAAPAALK
jgi:hypothetical protein